MRIIKNVVLFGIITLLPVVARAEKLVTQLRVSVNTFAIRQIDMKTPTRVVFSGAAVQGEVAVIAALLPSTKVESATMQLPSTEWWNHVRWTLEREDGETPALRVHATSQDRAVSRPDGTAELPAGQRSVAKINFGELPPGQYRLSASLGNLRSNVEWFRVSNGKENADMRREFARYKVDRSRDKQSLKKNLLELAATDPLNASPWIRLGDLALADGTADEIRGYYDRAVQVLNQRRQNFVGRGRDHVIAAIDRERDVILAVRELIPQYVANRGTMILHADLQTGRRYVLRDRATSRVLRTIAPRAGSEQP